MNAITRVKSVGKWLAFAVLALLPVLVLADKKPSTPAQKAAPHASAPAHTSTPSHTTNAGHTSTTSHTTTTGHTTTGHTTTTTGHTTTTNSHTTTTGHTTGTGNTPGGRNGNATGGHGGNTPGSHNGNMAGGHGAGPAGGNRGGHYQPARTTRTVGGHSVSRDNRGRVREIHTAHGTEIHHDMRGGRTLRSEHNGRVIYGDGRGHGYTQRAYYRDRRGRAYYQRTYYGRDGHMYAHAYRGYYWHGHPYYGYAPAFYWHPAYYGWAYNPWPAPVYWGWGWAGNPWYGYYGYYFAPAPFYATPALWLADYMLAANLQAAYAAEQAADAQGSQGGDPQPAAEAAPANSGASVTLTPEVKQAIAEEVRQQIDADRQAAAQNNAPASAAAPASDNSEAPPALDPKVRTFIVSSSLDVTGDNGQECALSPGDVIFRTGNDVIDGTDKVTVLVQSSQKNDCAIGNSEAVEVNDLQEMHNHFREQLDSGMQAMAKNSGQKGMPKAPDTGTSSGEVAAPTPDSDAASDIQAQQQDADQAEKQVAADPGGTN